MQALPLASPLQDHGNQLDPFYGPTAAQEHGFTPDVTWSGLAWAPLAHDQSNGSAFNSGIGQTAIDQTWISNNAFNHPPVGDTLFTTDAAVANVHEYPNYLANDFDIGLASALNDGLWVQPVFSTPMLAPEVAGQLACANPSMPRQAARLPLEAVVSGNGPFFCSKSGCNATYLRLGDCRRHLKKHNGPYFYCYQYGCNMKFYRNDKLQDHLKKGHGIIITAAASRRHRRSAD